MPRSAAKGATMTVFVVFQEGVYRHDCGGVFTSLELAKAAADQRKAAERDNYHEWTVVPFEVDAVVDEEADRAYTSPDDPAKGRRRW
jgi:hypothetical protein